MAQNHFNTDCRFAIISMQNRWSHSEIEVFYDGDCPLCKREIDFIRRKDSGQRIKFTDISDREFNTDQFPNRTHDDFMREIQGRILKVDNSSDDESWLTGVDVFREMYARIGFRRAVSWTRQPLIGAALAVLYRLFAGVRYWFAVRRMS